MPSDRTPFLTPDHAEIAVRALVKLRGEGTAPSYISHMLNGISVAVSVHPFYSDVRVNYAPGDRWLVGRVRSELTGDELSAALSALLTSTPYDTFAERLA